MWHHRNAKKQHSDTGQELQIMFPSNIRTKETCDLYDLRERQFCGRIRLVGKRDQITMPDCFELPGRI